jgi:hypothetical protein
MTEQLPASVCPARLEVDYPEQHDRVTVLFRVLLIIPIGILFGVLTVGASQRLYNQTVRWWPTAAVASPAACSWRLF